MLQTQNKEEENIGIDMQIIFYIKVLTKATSHQLAIVTLVRCVCRGRWKGLITPKLSKGCPLTPDLEAGHYQSAQDGGCRSSGSRDSTGCGHCPLALLQIIDQGAHFASIFNKQKNIEMLSSAKDVKYMSNEPISFKKLNACEDDGIVS